MPTYEYKCKQCGFVFEKFQSITAAPETACPQCSGRVQKLLSGGAGIIMKGTRQNNHLQCETCCPNEGVCENPKRCCED